MVGTHIHTKTPVNINVPRMLPTLTPPSPPPSRVESPRLERVWEAFYSFPVSRWGTRITGDVVVQNRLDLIIKTCGESDAGAAAVSTTASGTGGVELRRLDDP